MPGKAKSFYGSQLKHWLPRVYSTPPVGPGETVGRYAIALGCMILALVLRLAADPILREYYPFATFLLAIVIVNWWCGTGPSVMALLLSLPLGIYFFVPPRQSIALTACHWVGVAMYTLVGSILITFGGLFRQANYLLEDQIAEVKKHRESLAREVQEREILERNLRQQEEEFRTNFELSVVGQAQVDPFTARFLRVNSGLCELTGYTPEELASMSYFDLVHPEDKQSTRECFEDLIQGKLNRFGTEKRFSRRDGTVIHAEVAAALLRDESGRPFRVLGVFQDITARKQAESLLRRNQEMLRTIMDAIPSLIAYVDRDLRLQSFNTAYGHWFRLPLSEITNRRLREVMGEEAFERVRPHLEKVFATGEPVEFDEVLPCKSGLQRWVTCMCMPHAEDGQQVVGAVVLVTDMTARKQNELALQAVQDQLRHYTQDLEVRVAERTADLQQTIKSMQEFTYTIAHDLRAPLRAAHSFSTLLIEHFGRQLGEEGLEFAQRIAEASERMDHLIHDLLEYGRVASADMPLRDMTLRPLIEEVVEEVNATDSARGAHIKVEGQLPAVRANKILLRKALLHLLHNAVKFRKPEETPRVWIRAEKRNGRVRLLVQDNGLGIAAEFHEQIFRTFQRLSTARKEGTGMGLAIVQKAVERMRGQVGVESELGKGSCFWIELPAASEAEKAAQP
ncbi:MAG TPA: PAS domain S-box protein [Clostridia bacterium]|nr:PAS domain S-box protein [Clostridia bacterium]